MRLNIRQAVASKKLSVIWTISCLMILFIPQIFNVYAYLKNYNIIYTNIMNYIEKVVFYDTKMLQNGLEQIANIGIQISVNNNFKNTAEYSFPLSANEKYNIRGFTSDLSGYTLSDTDITEVYLYYPSSDRILLRGNDYQPEEVYKFNEIGKTAQYEDWYKAITDSDSHGFISINTGNKNTVYFKYITNLPGTYGESPVILLEIDQNGIIKSGENNYFAYIVDESNNIVVSSDANRDISSDDLPETWDESFIKCTNDSYIICGSKIPNTNWKYVCVFDKKYWLTPVEGTKNTIFVCLILALVVGIALVWCFVKQNEKPVENIIKQLNCHTRREYPEMNELSYISKAVEDALSENKKYENAIYKQEKYLISNILGRLVHGNASQNEIEMLESLGVYFKYDKYFAVSFYIENVSNIYFENGEETSDSLNHAQFIITNIISELLGEHFDTVFFNDNSFPVCIINLKNGDGHDKEKIKNIILEAWDLIMNKLNFSFVAGISCVHESMSGLKTAYEECIAVLDNRFINQECILDYEDMLSDDLNEYYYPIEKEELILRSLEAGDYAECKKQLDNIFEVNFDNNNLSLEHARILTMDIFCTFMRSVNRLTADKSENLIDSKKLLNDMERCERINDVKDLLYGTIKSFCDYTKTQVLDKGNNLISDIIKFVNENYSDTQLSVSVIAEHFNVHPNYISKAFKKNVGKGMLEYISEIRINAAKKMIENTDEPFEYIANRTGFSNIRTFYRVFSNIVGMTPGKYKVLKKK